MYQHPRNVSIKIQKYISSRARDIPKFVGFHQGSMTTTRLTYIQTNLKYLDPVYQHLRKVSKNSSKISHSELEISLCLISVRKYANYQKTPKHSRKISHSELKISLSLNLVGKFKQTDWQTYMKLRIICRKCTNITGISLKKSARYLIQNWRYPFLSQIFVRK